MVEQRKVVLVTSLGKKYVGFIDIPNAALRTTDLLNSSNIYWRNPAEKCFDNAILMYDAQLLFDNGGVYRKCEKIQIKLSKIIFFYDDFQTIGDEKERKRASVMVAKIQEKVQSVHIVTGMIANSFYSISGQFYGLFKKKSHDNFMPLTGVCIEEITKKEDKWFKKEIRLPLQFIGISTDHIESMILG